MRIRRWIEAYPVDPAITGAALLRNNLLRDVDIAGRLGDVDCWANTETAAIELREKIVDFRGALQSALSDISRAHLVYYRDMADARHTVAAGTETERTLARLTWVDAELRRLHSHNTGPGRSGAIFEIQTLKAALDERFFRELTPAYLRWSRGRGQRLLKDYETRHRRLARHLIEELGGLAGTDGKQRMSDVSYAHVLDSARDQVDLVTGATRVNFAVLYAELSDLVSLFLRAERAAQDVRDYCQFTLFAGTRTAEVDDICQSGSLRSLEATIAHLEAQRVVPTLEFLRWTEQRLGINTSDMQGFLWDPARWTADGTPLRRRPGAPPASGSDPAAPPNLDAGTSLRPPGSPADLETGGPVTAPPDDRSIIERPSE
jgi:hypothetical protein